jgi:hypothetical protein
MRLAGRLFLAICLSLTASTPSAQPQPTASDRENLVRSLMEAFNRQDPEAMASLVTSDVQWLTISDSNIATEAGSREELRTGMAAYFRSCPTCRSSIAGMLSTPKRVTAIEVAWWQVDGSDRSQRSISVYEFSGNQIRRVYYFPAERP